jgi:hypothetical protein
MPAPGNLGFETMGAAVGMADGWLVRGRSSAVEILGFGPNVTVGPIVAPVNLADPTTWTPTGATISGGAAADPDGQPTAYTIDAASGTALHGVENTTVALANGGRYGFACFVKPRASTWAALVLGAGTANETFAIVDLTVDAERVLLVSKGTGIAKASASIFKVANGWSLVTLYVETNAAILVKPGIFLPSDTALVCNAFGRRLYAWGAAIFDLPREGFEAFERAWLNDVFLRTLTIPDSAYPSTFLTSFPSPVGFEAFESGWGNFPFYSTISTSASATFDAGTPEVVEDLEEEWGATPFYTTIPGPVAATFDVSIPEAPEDFEDDWLTSPWITTLPAPVLADFDGDLGEGAEDFEEVMRDKVYSVDVGANNLVSASHGLIDGQTLYVVRPSGGELPSAFNATIRYFVVNSAPNTFQLAETLGGTPPTLGDPGIGVQKVRGDPSRYWNELDYNSTI